MKDFHVNEEKETISICNYRQFSDINMSTFTYKYTCNVPNGFSIGTDIVADEPIIHSGNFKGRISFSNPTMGQFWYILNLTATAAEAVVLDEIECMIGSSATISVPIENPFGTLQCHLYVNVLMFMSLNWL